MKSSEIELMRCPFHSEYTKGCIRCQEIEDLWTEWALRHRIEPFADEDETSYGEYKARQIERQKKNREQDAQRDTE